MKKDKAKGTQLIRNSTAGFLIFTGQSGEQSIEARYEDETIWLSQKLMAQLFDVGESGRAFEYIHYIAPKCDDLDELMEGWYKCYDRMNGSDIPPIVQASILSFGFVLSTLMMMAMEDCIDISYMTYWHGMNLPRTISLCQYPLLC